MSLFFMLGFVFQLNVTSLITGLGIGGLAIALAAKETLENLLGSFTIFFDKPFVLGDMVQVGKITGNVEQIGFRSTRIRTVDKTFVTVPNKRMVDAELENLSFRKQRRIEVKLHLGYETGSEQIVKILSDLKAAIMGQPEVVPAEVSVHFTEFEASTLQLHIVYMINSNLGEVYLAVKEKTNLKIMEILKNNGVSLAAPPQTVYLMK